MRETAEALLQGLQKCERVALARTITLIESSHIDDRLCAEHILTHLPEDMTHRRSRCVGISGMPGVGKSSFIEKLGLKLIEAGYKVAVLAIDPTSPISGGSILGDRTRMEELSRHDRCFIRPSPSGLQHGGVARGTRETIRLCEAVGYDWILVESVGVGQAEYTLQTMTDFFVLLQLPGSGDDLQGIKKGILEVADLVVIHKADGALETLAQSAKVEHERALHLVREEKVPVMLVSSVLEHGIDAVQTFLESSIQPNSASYQRRREGQRLIWFKQETLDQLREWIERESDHRQMFLDLESQVIGGSLPASVAARHLVEALTWSRE